MRFGRSHGVVGIRWVLPVRGGRRVFARRANSDVGVSLPPHKKTTDKHSSVDALVAETGASWMTGKGWPRII